MKKKGTKGRSRVARKRSSKCSYNSCYSCDCGYGDRPQCLSSNRCLARSCDRRDNFEEDFCYRKSFADSRQEPCRFLGRGETVRTDSVNGFCDDYNPLWSSRFCNNDMNGENKGIQTVVFLPWMFLLTILFVAWSFYNIYVNVVVGSTNTLLWGTLVFLAACYIGKQEVSSWRFYKGFSREFIVPRNYSTLIFVILGFMLKGFWAYFYITYVDIPCWMYLMDTLTSALVTGFFFGRTMFFFKAYLQPVSSDNSCRRNIRITNV